MALCSDVAEFKIQTGKKVYDGERERQKLEAVTAMAGNDFNKKGVYELFSQIMTISRKLQYGCLLYTSVYSLLFRRSMHYKEEGSCTGQK